MGLGHCRRRPGNDKSAGNPVLGLIVWVSASLKLTAAGLGLAVVLPRVPPRRLVFAAAWTAAVVLHRVRRRADARRAAGAGQRHPRQSGRQHRALGWHTYRWDPCFLAWGLLLTTAAGPRRCPACLGLSASTIGVVLRRWQLPRLRDVDRLNSAAVTPTYRRG
ncbi:MAG: DUF3995 domain-containing protein [Nocardioidaceae bacterium]